MPTTVTKKVGASNSPTAMDYSTLAAWAAACPANLVTADQIWDGQCYDQGKFTAGANVGSGVTTDSTRYIILECASGASFNTKAGVRTTALFYNDTTGSGVGVDTGNAGNNVTLSAQYTQVLGLQIKHSGYSLCLNLNTSNALVKNCILYRTSDAKVCQDAGSGNKWVNCLMAGTGASGIGVATINSMFNCTVVNTGGPGTSEATQTDYNAAVIKNCTFFGFSVVTHGAQSFSSTSDYNATDKSAISTAGGGGTHNVLNLTFASQFTSTTTDFRATFGSGLHAGTPDATNSPSDISLTGRDGTTPYIGAWEATAPAAGFTIAPTAIPKNHTGNITLTLTGSGTSWVNGVSVFTPSGVTGVTKISQNVTSSTAATVVITDDATHTGTLTITESVTGTNTATTTIGTATLAVSPTSGTVSGTTAITLTGTNTTWAQDHPVFTYTGGPAGTSIGTIAWTNDTTATAIMTCGAATGAGTLTDPSTGQTCTFTVSAIAGSITVTTPTAFQGRWRDPANSNRGSIPITGTYTGGPGTKTIEASFNGGAYVTIATGAGGTFSGTLTNQAIGNGTLTVRFALATSISTTVANVAIGVVIVIAGQSNATGQLTNFQVYVNGSGPKSTCFIAGNSSYTAPSFWGDGVDPFTAGYPTGSPWPLLATHLMRNLSVPVIFIETAIGGRSLVGTDWFWTKRRPDTGASSTGYTEIINSINNAATGGVDAVIWYQGENDIDLSISRHVYAQALGTFADQLAADVTNAPKLAIVQPGYNGAGGVPLATADGIKLALADAVNAGGNVVDSLVSVYDFSNGLHILSDAEGQKVAGRMYAVLASEVFGSGSGLGRGPRVVSCQYNSTFTTVTVCFDKVLKTGLTFSTSAWSVTGNAIAATVSTVAYHATNTRAVVLTLSAAAALPIRVSFGLGSPAGLTVPLGPDFTLPAPAGNINLPAELFKDMPAAAAEVSGGGGGGGLLTARGFTGGVN